MREIKFRVWDPHMKTMRKGWWPTGKKEYDQVVMTGLTWLGDGSLRVSEDVPLPYPSSNYPDEYPVMQYTGRKDKNGKEIYEGDILRFAHMKGKVFYEDFAFLWDGNPPAHQAWPHDAEVIGNIYENPELLEEG